MLWTQGQGYRISFGDGPTPHIPVCVRPWMYESDCIGDMKADFLETVRHSRAITVDAARLRGWQRLLAERMKAFSPLL